MLAAIRHEPVDRVPFATYNLNPLGPNEHTKDATYRELLAKVEQSAGVFAKIRPKGLSVGLSGPKEGMVETLTEGSGDDRKRIMTVHTPKGDLESITFIPENKPPYNAKPLLASEEDAEKYMSIPYEPPVWDVSGVHQFVDAAQPWGVPLVMYTEPFSAICKSFDFEDFCIRCLTERPLIEKLIEWAFERCLENVRLLAEACKGIECVLHTGGVETCTPPMLSPALFRDVITPRLMRITDAIHGAGLFAGIHCHGRVKEVLPEIIAAGTDLLEPLEPPEQGNITLAELMEQAEGKLCMVGYIQDQEIYTAKPGDMTKRVEEIAAVVAGRTGYVMTPTCTPFDHPCSDVYRRNYLEWLEAGERLL
jgi:uroporphyrinogen-III decarboxylase